MSVIVNGCLACRQRHLATRLKRIRFPRRRNRNRIGKGEHRHTPRLGARDAARDPAHRRGHGARRRGRDVRVLIAIVIADQDARAVDA